jgi:hypothetical protein
MTRWNTRSRAYSLDRGGLACFRESRTWQVEDFGSNESPDLSYFSIAHGDRSVIIVFFGSERDCELAARTECTSCVCILKYRMRLRS